jgi:glycosyltransferase involved in cell wall biosynthesis
MQSSENGRGRRPTIVHVLPVDLARGAQRYARALRNELHGSDVAHRTMTLFSGEPAVLNADVELGVRPGRLRSIGFDPRAALRLWRQLRTMKPDVVVAHGGEALKYVVVTRPRGVRIAYYKIGISSAHLERPLRKSLYRRLAGRADVVAGVSEEAVEEAMHLFGLPTERVHLIVNGRDPAVFRANADVRPGHPRVTFVGHLTSGKRPDVFVAMVGKLRGISPPFQAVAVGDGPLFDALQEPARQADVTLLGRVDDVAPVLAASDVFVFTSDPEGEGMPGVLIEASLCGVPVVTTDVPGARSVVEEGVTGFIVPTGDEDALVRAVHRLLTDVDLRERMGAAARERCLEHFTLEASAGRWRDLLEDLLTRHDT